MNAFITWPCANCNRELLGARIHESILVCPCGSEYQLRNDIQIEGVPGTAILLGRQRADRDEAGPCPSCGAIIGIGHIPNTALFYVDGQGLFLTDLAGQLCPLCKVPVPVPREAEEPKYWRDFSGERRR